MCVCVCVCVCCRQSLSHGFTHQKAGVSDRSLFAASGQFICPPLPTRVERRRPPHGCHYQLPSKPQQQPRHRETVSLGAPTLHTAHKQMGPEPKHFTSCCHTSRGRLKDVFTAARANRGGYERRPHAGASCPGSPQVCEKRKRSRELAHSLFSHSNLQRECSMTYTGAYVEVSHTPSSIVKIKSLDSNSFHSFSFFFYCHLRCLGLGKKLTRLIVRSS